MNTIPKSHLIVKDALKRTRSLEEDKAPKTKKQIQVSIDAGLYYRAMATALHGYGLPQLIEPDSGYVLEDMIQQILRECVEKYEHEHQFDPVHTADIGILMEAAAI